MSSMTHVFLIIKLVSLDPKAEAQTTLSKLCTDPVQVKIS